MPISYGQQWPDHALRALAEQANGARRDPDREDERARVVYPKPVGGVGGAGFTLAPVLETTDDDASGTAHPLASLVSHTTTGAKDVESVAGFKRFVRLVAADPGADVTWQCRVTKTF